MATNAVGMPVLSEMQEEFVRLMADTGNAAAAARAAGYASPDTQGRQILRRPGVLAAVRIETARRIADLAPVAIGVLSRIMQDESAPKGVRVDAAKTLLDRGGYVSDPKRKTGYDEEKPLNEMSMDELHTLVEKLGAERAAEARLVSTIEPVSAPLERRGTPPETGNAPLLRATFDEALDPLG